MARLRTERATSAGGIVVRVRDGRLQLVLGMRRREQGVTWTLPKGKPRPGETLAETALREVREETGLVVEIRRPIGSIRYTFNVGDTRIEKVVHYFLMAPRGGRLARHDREFARVRWVDLEAAPSLLTFETERELVSRVARLLTSGGAEEAGLEGSQTEPDGQRRSEAQRSPAAQPSGSARPGGSDRGEVTLRAGRRAPGRAGASAATDRRPAGAGGATAGAASVGTANPGEGRPASASGPRAARAPAASPARVAGARSDAVGGREAPLA